MAANQRRPAAQAEALALLALEAARRGAASNDESLLDAAASAAREARRIVGQLAGRPPWAAQADAAESRVALARGDNDSALQFARSAMDYLQSSMREDPHLEILLPAARAVLAAGEPEEKQGVTGQLQVYQAFGASRMMDEQVRVRWFRGPVGSELAELAGPIRAPSAGVAAPARGDELDESQNRVLHMLVQGHSNREIGEELSLDDAGVNGLLSALYAQIGTSSRAETTAFAFRAV